MFHTVILVGNLGREPEMRFTPSGQQVTNFSVATNRTFNNNAGEQVKETVWFRISTWGKLAETCNRYLHKGSRVLVEGRLIPDPATGGPRVYQGQSGSGASFEINAATVRFLSSNGDGSTTETTLEGSEAEADSIPF